MSKIQSALDLTIAFKFNGVTVEIVTKELKKEKNLWLICFCLCVVEGERVGGGIRVSVVPSPMNQNISFSLLELGSLP